MSRHSYFESEMHAIHMHKSSALYKIFTSAEFLSYPIGRYAELVPRCTDSLGFRSARSKGTPCTSPPKDLSSPS